MTEYDLDLDDILGTPDTDSRPKPKRKAFTEETSGDLHALLTEKLPEILTPSGVCDIRRLAKMLGMTHQGVYRWMKPNKPHRLPYPQAKRIVALSNTQKGGEGWTPATLEDFDAFLSF